MAFTQPLDVYNRALQHLGKRRISSLAEVSDQAREINACYDVLRLAELQQLTWYFAIKRARLRSITSTTKLFAPSAWAIGTTYTLGQIVAYAGYSWALTVPTSTGEQPDTSPHWEHYFATQTADTFAATNTYDIGELAIGSNSSVYTAIVNGTANDPMTTAADWTLVAGTATAYKVRYPLDIGSNQGSGFAYNAYRLPNGFLRRAPMEPKRGRYSALGAPSGLSPDDFLLESGLLLTRTPGPITLRFVADVWDVNDMHALFCEMLAAKVAWAVCEPLTQSDSKQALCTAAYKAAKHAADNADAIVQGAVQPTTDEYLTCRA